MGHDNYQSRVGKGLGLADAGADADPDAGFGFGCWGLGSLFPQPAAADLAPLVGACSAPYAQGLVALNGEVQTGLLDGALGAHSLSLLEACVIVAAKKEVRVGEIATKSLALPRLRGLDDQWGYFCSHRSNNHYGAVAIPGL